MSETSPDIAYNHEVLAVLLWEMLPSQQSDTERKIKRRLRDKRLGEYDQDRVDALRLLKETMAGELSRRSESIFHRGTSGKHSNSDDWDTERLARHLIDKHADIPEKNIRAILPNAIRTYYLR